MNTLIKEIPIRPIKIQYKHERYRLQKAYENDSAYDLCANTNNTTIELMPLKRIKIDTGIYISIPKYWEATIRPRSGLSQKYGITVLNSPGTIDPDYTGEISVIIINLGEEPFTIQDGDRIAQLTIQKTPRYKLTQEQLIATITNYNNSPLRGNNGFGSSEQTNFF